ncbi:MAG: hypothetical protein K2Q25_15035 [Mycobacteriaceae bacterium]|nr:hypothetical protein [Mycobacteriaceae bacterium]
MTDPAITNRFGLGIIDQVGRALGRDGDNKPGQNWARRGTHGQPGLHTPSGFVAWLAVAW